MGAGVVDEPRGEYRRRPILDAGTEELATWCAEQGEPAYRAAQVRQAVLHRRVADFGEMTDLPRRLRESLADSWSVLGSRVLSERRDRDRSQKLLVGLDDGQTIECVLLFDRRRRTVCVSTQVGCAMRCVFCASGLEGVVRNLKASEIVEQLLHAERRLGPQERASHIVVMGMGEPLANLDALLPALALATSPDGLGLSARHVTISTVGLPQKIRQLAEAGQAYHLAVSLHAPNDVLRRQLVPTARSVRIEDLLAASDHYRQATGRQVTFEYVLLAGINDRPQHARQLAQVLRGRDAMVNLIPYNPVAGLPYRSPTDKAATGFADILRRAGLVVHTRRRRGAGIDAACGQLRRSASTGLGSHDLPDGMPVQSHSCS